MGWLYKTHDRTNVLFTVLLFRPDFSQQLLRHAQYCFFSPNSAYNFFFSVLLLRSISICKVGAECKKRSASTGADPFAFHRLCAAAPAIKERVGKRRRRIPFGADSACLTHALLPPALKLSEKNARDFSFMVYKLLLPLFSAFFPSSFFSETNKQPFPSKLMRCGVVTASAALLVSSA